MSKQKKRNLVIHSPKQGIISAAHLGDAEKISSTVVPLTHLFFITYTDYSS